MTTDPDDGVPDATAPGTPALEAEGPLVELTLVLRAQDGDVGAFEVLVNRYQGRLFRVAFMILNDRQDAEDVVQESLLLAWKRLELLTDPNAFRSWINRICTRRATDLIRLRSRRATTTAADDRLESAGTTAVAGAGVVRDPAHSVEIDQQLQALARIMATMDPELRACWVLREVEGMSYNEIGHVLALTEPTVRGRIARARSLVIHQMQEWR